MDMFQIACPTCKALHPWISISLDQRCYKCKYAATDIQRMPAQAPDVSLEPIERSALLPKAPYLSEDLWFAAEYAAWSAAWSAARSTARERLLTAVVDKFNLKTGD
jgi:hypothetical protein